MFTRPGANARTTPSLTLARRRRTRSSAWAPNTRATGSLPRRPRPRYRGTPMPDSDRILRAGEGRYAGGPDFGIRFMLSGDRTGGGFSMVEHPIGPRVLAAPLHRHRYEDEWSFVLEGEVGCQLGDDVVV